MALTARDRERFRHFRHSLPELVNDTVRQSGAMKMNTDYAVPLARNREMLAYYRERLEESFPGAVRDLRPHWGRTRARESLLRSRESSARHRGAGRRARHAELLGGTVSAEHGLGKRKAHLLKLQYAPELPGGHARREAPLLPPRVCWGGGTLGLT